MAYLRKSGIFEKQQYGQYVQNGVNEIELLRDKDSEVAAAI